MTNPKQPDANSSGQTRPDDSDLLLSGETATTGVDEGETGGRTKAPEGDAPDGVQIGGPRLTPESANSDDPAGEDPTDAAGGAKQGEGGKSDV